MKELIEYRKRLVERLADAAHKFRSASEDEDSSAVIEGEWTLHQMAVHVRDIDRLIYSARVRRTLQEQNPLFQSIDPDEWMAKNYDRHEPLQKVLSEFEGNVKELCGTLDGIPDEAWSRTSRHETMGEGLTLQWWVERSLSHIEEHLGALKKSI